MKAPIKVVIILLIFVAGLGSFWVVGNRVKSNIMEMADVNPVVQIEDYQQGIFKSSFRVTTYGGQLRLKGEVDHGPLPWSLKSPGLASLRLTVDPFQVVTSPWKTIIETIPDLQNAYLDINVGMTGAARLSGQIPEMEIEIPSKEGDFIFSYSGMTLDGTASEEQYTLNGISEAFGLKGPQQMEMGAKQITFSSEGKNPLELIPESWSSKTTLHDLSMSWHDKEPQYIQAAEMVVTSKGGVVDEAVEAGALYQVNQVTMNGQSFGNLLYSASMSGLDQKGLVDMVRWASSVAQVAEEADPSEILGDLLPILHRILSRDPKLEIRVATDLQSFGDNEAIFQLELSDEKHQELPVRVVAGVDLSFDERAVVHMARLTLSKQPALANESVDVQEQAAQALISGLTGPDGMLEKTGDRYRFTASYSGKESMVRYGKTGLYPFDLKSFSEFLTVMMAAPR